MSAFLGEGEGQGGKGEGERGSRGKGSFVCVSGLFVVDG